MRLFSLSEASIQRRTSRFRSGPRVHYLASNSRGSASEYSTALLNDVFSLRVCRPGGSVHGERANFRELVCGCIDTSDSEKRRIFQHFSRSTRLSLLRTAPNPKFQQKNAAFFPHFCQNFAKFEQCLKRFLQMEAVQKCENLVVLEKC